MVFLRVHLLLNVLAVSLLVFCFARVNFTFYSPSALTAVFSLCRITVTSVAPTKSVPEPQQAKISTELKTVPLDSKDHSLKVLESRTAKTGPETQVPAAKQIPEGLPTEGNVKHLCLTTIVLESDCCFLTVWFCVITVISDRLILF